MKKYFYNALNALLITVAGFLGLLIIYLVAALLLSVIPVNKKFTGTSKTAIPVYLLSNGVHLDIVVQKVNEYKDWRNDLQIDPFIESGVKLVAFGWGDREFYMNTPEWSDLRFSTAFNALFLRDSSAMHVSYYRNLTENDRCRKVTVSKEQYLNLIGCIESSLYHDTNDRTVLIRNTGYNQFDQFYEANRSYHLFYTCNTWTNSVLKKSELRACLWTPFDKGILWQYRKY